MHIWLHDNNLTGTLPPELGNFPYLETFMLDQNAIGGPIPHSIGNLSILHDLSLDLNALTGSIPPELGNLTNLTQLSLSNNNLSGPLPEALGNLTKLQELYFGLNQISGPIPSSFGNLTNLWDLRAWGNQLSGSIPPEIGNLTKLRYMELEYNQLDGTIPATLGNLSNLLWLDLSYNKLSGPIPQQIGNLHELNGLKFWGNRLIGNLPSALLNLTQLVTDYVDLRWNALYSSDPALIAFLDSKQYGGDWQSFQTVAPDNVAASEGIGRSVKLTWSPILYTGNTGGYRIHLSTVSGGPYSLYETTPNKTTSFHTVDGLQAGTQYYFILQTFTNPCNRDQNTVLSEFSQEVSATTDCAPDDAELNSPHDGASGVGIEVPLIWSPGDFADYYEVYAGPKMGEFTLMGTTADTSFLLTDLAEDTTYEWMISAVNECGFNHSRVWSFTTAGADNQGGHTRPVSPP